MYIQSYTHPIQYTNTDIIHQCILYYILYSTSFTQVTKILIEKLSDFRSKLKEKRNKNIISFYDAILLNITYYIPLSGNIAFHKICAKCIWIQVIGHVIAHYVNIVYAGKMYIPYSILVYCTILHGYHTFLHTSYTHICIRMYPYIHTHYF